VKTLLAKTRKKLQVVKKYLPHSIVVGFALGLANALYIGFLETFKIQTVLVMWLGWFIALSIILPAVLDDEFSFEKSS
jgi:uncharacterized protein (DUF2062 family)